MSLSIYGFLGSLGSYPGEFALCDNSAEASPRTWSISAQKKLPGVELLHVHGRDTTLLLFLTPKMICTVHFKPTGLTFRKQWFLNLFP
jgi:hypothetical protein